MLKRLFFIVLLISPITLMAGAAGGAGTPPLTTEQELAVKLLEAQLAAATTPEAKAQVIQNAVAAYPALASNPVLSSSLEAAAVSSGLSLDQVDVAVSSGVANQSASGSTGIQALINNAVDSGLDTATIAQAAEDAGMTGVESAAALVSAGVDVPTVQAAVSTASGEQISIAGNALWRMQELLILRLLQMHQMGKLV